jgi:hypothetical protein
MKYGFVLPSGEARLAAEFALQAEQFGWDGFFVWEPIWGIDAWVSLAAASMVTKRIHLGTLLSPVSRMRPWKLASETATLDNLSNGRVILSVGLGAVETGFSDFGEITDRKIRAELVDESLEIITSLWLGQPFKHAGKHYQVQITSESFRPPPRPIQQPRIPIWVVGAWPRMKSMHRVLRYDGLLPNVMAEDGKVRMEPASPSEIIEIKKFIDDNRIQESPFDIVMEGRTPGDDPQTAAEIISPYVQAGITWWIETMWDEPNLDLVLERIRLGPPNFSNQ